MSTYRVARDLVRYETPDGLVLMSGRFPRPLVFSRGIAAVEAALASPDSVSSEKLLELLVRYKILLPDDDDSADDAPPATYQRFDPSAGKDFALYLLVTQACNLGCKYCLGDNDSFLNGSRMSSDTARSAMRNAAEATGEDHTLQMIYFGGEPLLNWPLIKECVEFGGSSELGALRCKVKHHITTNLTVLPRDFVDVAVAAQVTVLVDIDGNCSTHNKMRPYRGGRPSYETILKNLEALRDAGIYYEVRATITSDNVGDLREILGHHHDLSPGACAFPSLIPVDSTGTVLDQSMYPDPDTYRAELKAAARDGLFDLSSFCPTNVIGARMLRGEFVRWGCGMLFGNTGVASTDGSAYPCIYFVGQEGFRQGDVNVGDANPFAQESYRRLFETWGPRLDVDSMPECRPCAIRYLCGGGCPVRTMGLPRDDDESQLAREYFHKVSCATSWAGVEATIEHFVARAKVDNGDGRGG